MSDVAFDMPLEHVVDFLQTEVDFWTEHCDLAEENAKKWQELYNKAVQERDAAQDEVAKLKARLFDLVNA